MVRSDWSKGCVWLGVALDQRSINKELSKEKDKESTSMTSVVHVDPGLELGGESKGPPPSSPSPNEPEKEVVEPWIAQVKSSEGNNE